MGSLRLMVKLSPSPWAWLLNHTAWFCDCSGNAPTFLYQHSSTPCSASGGKGSAWCSLAGFSSSYQMLRVLWVLDFLF